MGRDTERATRRFDRRKVMRRGGAEQEKHGNYRKGGGADQTQHNKEGRRDGENTRRVGGRGARMRRGEKK